MPKAFLNLLLKGGNNSKKESQDLNVKTPEDAVLTRGSGIGGANAGGIANRNPKINTTMYTRDLDFETLDLVGIHIQAMAEEELQKISVVSIKQDDKEEKRGNYVGTIADNRMYPQIKPFCSTCLLPKIFCPGHLAHRKLVRPIINIWFYKYVVSVLESICHVCGTLLMNLETAKRYGKSVDRLKKIADASKTLTCRNRDCGNYENPNPSFIKKTDNMLKIQLKYPNSKMGNISSTKILTLFNSLMTEELEALGFPQNTRYSIHPKNMLFTSLPILPVNHRPDGMVDGETRPNPMTSIYHNIIKIDNSLSSGIRDDRMSLEALENEVCSIHFRDSDAIKSGNSNAIDTSKNINEILSKKKGLIRSSAQAKRCNHTGRTVLGPGGPGLRFGEIRLPEAMSKILMEERICDKNIDYYTDLIQRGLISSIITRDQKISALKRHSDFVLKKGMIVRRPLQSGDPIIFNRNPTLHKHSMMGYIAKMAPGLTIGVHSSCTTPHTAD